MAVGDDEPLPPPLPPLPGAEEGTEGGRPNPDECGVEDEDEAEVGDCPDPDPDPMPLALARGLTAAPEPILPGDTPPVAGLGPCCCPCPSGCWRCSQGEAGEKLPLPPAPTALEAPALPTAAETVTGTGCGLATTACRSSGLAPTAFP